MKAFFFFLKIGAHTFADENLDPLNKACPVALALLMPLHTSKYCMLISLKPYDLYIEIKKTLTFILE